MRYPWHRVPEPIRAELLQGTSGRAHLLNMAMAALNARNEPPVDPAETTDKAAQANTAARQQTLLRLGSELLLASWEEQVFDRQTTANLLGLDKAAPFLSEPVRVTARQLLENTCLPQEETLSKIERLTRNGDTDALFAFVQQHLHSEPGNHFWQGMAQFLAIRHGCFSWLAQWIDQDLAMPEPLRKGLQADIALLHGQWAEAAAGYGAAHAALPLDIWQERRAQALTYLGQRQEALALLDDLLKRRPWHVQRRLQRDGLARNLDLPGAPPQGPGVILLYTWNGGHKIHRTLEGLANSELPPFAGTAQILLADNGSTDGETLQSMAAWKQTLGERLRLITLPCNIGAPPARNWLLAQPETRASEWVVYLDDDLIVPQKWLGHFGTAMQAEPDHGVYGCQILRDDVPQIVQAADMHLLPPSMSQGPGGWLPTSPVHMQATFHGQNAPDFGQFAYTRPCVHVSGCCHLFRRSALDACGGFDLRFAPTQVDDFEHDIRMVTQGNMPLYHGYLRVRHCHTTGLGTATDLGKAMNAHANHLKLQGLYPPPAFADLRKRANNTLLQDLLQRQREGAASGGTTHDCPPDPASVA